ncbi:arginine/agmatine antiporter [Pseudomonas sp. CCI3.2]|uniref:arginine/agmatine antiporter n=1 Tax=unclassified Pseudomonas TaxID=196821 RepID=UPI002AC9630E|nr:MULTISPECIES: arginine/agmatine antiporter [unclassified Pseudomonas]MEB0079681.1 arginine/agmatine antiporter [Pseudomonas sp. MH10out]MEB0093378.1 arginine/agmatine antiporter [Pseudomonas sp. CCI4.2]MEB0104007.1 arginine/agmatine antiporter [Pseudomonas sp. CCI3.2]MEB0133209.1 arginine/agmatine antiporter [Pseudomonas sp. CCI2.4]MEB0160395.1 arginine/agmatine antiporter [Pseudomonas sp. AH2 (2023)]
MAAIDDDSNKMGLTPAILMVAGNMMGSGVFMLPANLAGIGSIALYGWLITIVGSVALALTFAKLASIDPAAGGPYAYTRKAFGNYMGYQTNLVYWLANVLGNVGLAVAGLGYLTHFFPSLKEPLVFAIAQIFVIWLLTYGNILGPKLVGRVQSVTTIFALFPIVGMALFGWFWFSGDVYMAGWNVSGKSDFSAVGMTLNFTLWAFIGVESASVSAAVVRNPRRNVPIATVGGVIIAAVCYILSSSVIMGMIPNKELISSSAPFADAARLALGNTAANIVALCAAIGCLGSLAGWTLLVGQTAKAAADDGLFQNVFSRVNAKGVPAAGLAIVAAIMSVQVLVTMSPTASEQFGKIASIAVIMTLLPYIYSCISIKVLGYKAMPPNQYALYTFIGLVGAVYSIWAMVGSDGAQTRWALIFVIATIVFYSGAITRRREIEEGHLHPGGISPTWVRYMALAMVIAALIGTFWVSVGSRDDLNLQRRVPLPGELQQPAVAPAPAAAP